METRCDDHDAICLCFTFRVAATGAVPRARVADRVAYRACQLAQLRNRSYLQVGV